MGISPARLAAIVLLATLTATLVSCARRPRAPVLRNEPIYQNDQEGFRFVAPEGWTQRTKSALPPGKVERERSLVEYRAPAGGGGVLRVTIVDLPESTDMAAHLASPSFGVKQWQPSGQPVPLAGDGPKGVRYGFRGQVGKDALVREVAAFRRGERVYLFTALYAPTEAEVRDQVRRAVASLIWKKDR